MDNHRPQPPPQPPPPQPPPPLRDEAAAGAGDAKAHLFVFTNGKAGMDSVDQSKVNQVIYEQSKNSAYFANAEKRDAKTDVRVAKMQRDLARLQHEDLAPLRRALDRKAAALERARDLSRVKVVVDLDCFFAAVAALDDPTLRGKPFAVGGIGMLSTSSYEARKFGVRSAMPGFIAKKLCPELIIVPSNFPRYVEMAKRTRGVFAHFDPSFRAASLDEAYLDLTDYLRREGSGLGVDLGRPGECRATAAAGDFVGDGDASSDGEGDDEASGVPFRAEVIQSVVRRLRRMVFEATGGLTCSAGIAPSSMLAKICSDLNKPDGQMLLPFRREAVLDFTRSLAVRKIPGVGKVTEKLLTKGAGVATVADLWERRAEVFRLFRTATAEWLLRVSLGCTGGGAEEEKEAASREEQRRKSISTERTFRNCSDPKVLLATCARLCKSLAEACGGRGGGGGEEEEEAQEEERTAEESGASARASATPEAERRRRRERSIRGRTVTLKIKTSDFDVQTKQTAVSGRALGYGDEDEIYRHASALLQSFLQQRPGRLTLRLMGVRLSHLTFPPPVHESRSQTDFFASFKQQGAGGGSSLPPSPVPATAAKAKPDFFEAFKQRTPAMAAEGAAVVGAAAEERGTQRCPICGISLSGSNAVLNAHVDLCLNEGVILQERRRQREQPVGRPGKKRSRPLDAYFARR